MAFTVVLAKVIEVAKFQPPWPKSNEWILMKHEIYTVTTSWIWPRVQIHMALRQRWWYGRTR